ALAELAEQRAGRVVGDLEDEGAVLADAPALEDGAGPGRFLRLGDLLRRGLSAAEQPAPAPLGAEGRPPRLAAARPPWGAGQVLVAGLRHGWLPPGRGKNGAGRLRRPLRPRDRSLPPALARPRAGDHESPG